MARLNQNPVKSPLSGSEGGSLTDPTTDNDVGFTPLTITQFAQQNMTLATGSTQGLVSGPNGDKIAQLPTEAQLTTKINQLAEVAIPIFVSTPVNGSIAIYQHVCDVPWVLAFAYGVLSAGSTTATLTKNGANIAGFTNVNLADTVVTMTGTDTPANMTLNQQDILGVTLAGTTGAAANLRISLRANATIS